MSPSFPSPRRWGRAKVGGSVWAGPHRTPTPSLPRSQEEGAKISVTVIATGST